MPHAGPLLEEPAPLSDLLNAGLKGRPNDAALVSMEGVWSWAELERATSRIAANYLALGLKPGDRVASLMPNRTALFVHYIGCFKAGLVVTPLNYRYMPPEINHALDVSEARIILAHNERAADIAGSKAASLPLGVMWYGGDGSQKPSFEDLMAAEPKDASLPPIEAKAPAAIFFTSGSTGPAKGVTHTRESLACIFASAAQGFELTPNDILLPGSSCSHIGGFGFSMSALLAGARVVVARSFDHDEIGPLLRTTRPTLLSMLPTALLHLIREHDMTSADFSSLRLARSGGDKVSAELEKEYRALTGHTVSEGYGMTEFGLAALNPPIGVDKLGSIGLPSPGFIFSIRNDKGHELPKEKEGRLWVRTPSQCAGYWSDAEASAEVVREGWFDTGDVMKVDKDGYLWFCGRQKQIIVHDGSNISPQEVEDALLEHPAVELAGVVGVIDEAHGESVRAYVELKSGAAQPKAGELIQFAKARVGYKAPEEIVFLDEMPLNPTGKVDRAALKKLAAGDHAHHV
ncbi:MAG: class I adenylate-forming enzyme family protein [Methyloceanibacter sp.]|uniref:class I adenylate-forming enzyme family protein n=1 Tax=Methyloceanibacter sp. TaxID=1965321 RepID=UPI003D6C9674